MTSEVGVVGCRDDRAQSFPVLPVLDGLSGGDHLGARGGLLLDRLDA